MAKSWSRRAPSIDVAVECNGAGHTVRYHRGSIVVLDHDLAGERSLQALGGDEPACLDVLRAWRHTNLDTVSTPEAVRSRMRSHGRVPDWVVSLPAGLEGARRQSLLMRAERAGQKGQGYLLRETQRLAAPQLQRWLVVSGESARQPLRVAVTVAPPSTEPSVSLWREAGTLVINVALHPSWWRDVALFGSALTDEGKGFVLERGRVLRWQEGRVRG
ncbi:MAG: hypothetical protein QOF60_3122 [Actinomycetota bacterium]|jgi:hypothetical protein|nr:hypothetical protein [Actinomycetota bacterium]